MYSNINVVGIENGMTVKDVQNIVEKPMSQVSMSTDEDGQSKEVYGVQKRIVRGGVARQEKYHFIFKNKKLVEYQKVSEKASF
jgi:chemotaxis signal transduction protein